jgi:hypothetical protein
MGIHSPSGAGRAIFSFSPIPFWADMQRRKIMKGKPDFPRHFDAKIDKYVLNIKELRKEVVG